MAEGGALEATGGRDVAINRPNLQGIASRITGETATPAQAQARAQDAYNLDVYNALAPLLAPLQWVPLTPINSWVQFTTNTDSNSPAYMQMPNGWVRLRGLLRAGSISTNMFAQRVPAPAHQWFLSVYSDDGSGAAGNQAGGLVVSPDGSVQLRKGGTALVALDGAQYYAGAE